MFRKLILSFQSNISKFRVDTDLSILSVSDSVLKGT